MMVISYLKNRLFQCRTFCLLTLLFVAGWSFGQSGKVNTDLANLYRIRLEEHLFPRIDTLVAKEVVLIIVKPSFNPEYSIRIVERGNQSFIEGRSLDKSLWYELLEQLKKQDKKSFSIKMSYYSTPISDNFKDKMLTSITSLIRNNKIKEGLSVDGISYEFRIFDKGERVQSVEIISPETSPMEDHIVNLCTQMFSDLQSQSFDEAKYNGKLH